MLKLRRPSCELLPRFWASWCFMFFKAKLLGFKVKELGVVEEDEMSLRIYIYI